METDAQYDERVTFSLPVINSLGTAMQLESGSSYCTCTSCVKNVSYRQEPDTVVVFPHYNEDKVLTVARLKAGDTTVKLTEEALDQLITSLMYMKKRLEGQT